MSLQSRKSCQAGLTLIEVLTAASLLGILSVIGATNFRAQIPAFRTRGAALMIAGDINQARLAAVKEGRQYFYVPDAGTTYRIDRLDAFGNVENVKTVNVAAEFEGVTFATTATDDPYGGGGTPPAVPGAQMIFHSNGIVQNAAGVYLQAAMGAEDHSEHAVTVTAAGRVRIWRYDGSDWS